MDTQSKALSHYDLFFSKDDNARTRVSNSNLEDKKSGSDPKSIVLDWVEGISPNSE